MNKYCCNRCGTESYTRVEEREETIPVRGEEITIRSRFRICESCGEEVYDRGFFKESLDKANDLYRERQKIISPSEIRSIREKYGLSQRKMAALLGWGNVTIHHYESGCVPDKSHSQTLYLLRDPANMVRMLELNPSLDSVAEQELTSHPI